VTRRRRATRPATPSLHVTTPAPPRRLCSQQQTEPPPHPPACPHVAPACPAAHCQACACGLGLARRSEAAVFPGSPRHGAGLRCGASGAARLSGKCRRLRPSTGRAPARFSRAFAPPRDPMRPLAVGSTLSRAARPRRAPAARLRRCAGLDRTSRSVPRRAARAPGRAVGREQRSVRLWRRCVPCVIAAVLRCAGPRAGGRDMPQLPMARRRAAAGANRRAAAAAPQAPSFQASKE
jgi:hypothetical protein